MGKMVREMVPDTISPWVSKAVAQFGLENSLRNRWRPEKGTYTVLSPENPARSLPLIWSCLASATREFVDPREWGIV
ncbi:MAG: hypothetical protein ACLQVL_02510 [Terriglobia bacterium]